VLNASERSVRGEWSQRGEQLLVLFDTPPVAPGRRRIDPAPLNRETSLTIDLADDTTLVLTGAMFQRNGTPSTFLRVK
jgi:hypothetical protein